MKIAFLTPEYPHSKFGPSGGIGTSILNLSTGLLQAGHKVAVLIYGCPKDEVFEENDIIFYCIKNVKIKGLSWYFTRKKIEKLINDLYGEKKIDMVEAPDWTGITSFISSKCPIVIRQNGSDTYFCYLDGRGVKFFNRFHEKRAMVRADAIVSVSQFTGDLTNELFRLNRSFTVIPNSIDARFFSTTTILETSGCNVLYFGSLIRKKGLLELPLIFNKVVECNPQARLTLIGRDVRDIVSGNSSTWEMMKKLFSTKALNNVTYLGSVPYETIKQYILDANVCVFPSFAEALPVSWLEAMALQKAVVASSVGWASEMIEEGVEGFLVDPKNHTVYAERICDLLNDPILQKEFGINARSKIHSKFDVSVVTLKNIEFYKSVIKE